MSFKMSARLSTIIMPRLCELLYSVVTNDLLPHIYSIVNIFINQFSNEKKLLQVTIRNFVKRQHIYTCIQADIYIHI